MATDLKLKELVINKMNADTYETQKAAGTLPVNSIIFTKDTTSTVKLNDLATKEYVIQAINESITVALNTEV